MTDHVKDGLVEVTAADVAEAQALADALSTVWGTESPASSWSSRHPLLQMIARHRIAATSEASLSVERMREVLEEFDDALGEDDEYPDDTPLTLSWGRTKVMMRLAHLRRARAALNATAEGGER